MRISVIGLVTGLTLVVTSAGANAQTEGSVAAPLVEKELVSLLDVAPAAYWTFTRKPKFFSDPNMDLATVDGPLWQRQYLLGSLGGFRSRMASNGLVFDADLTQVFQHKSSGDGDSSAYAGSADIWLALDTGRAGWWSGGLFVSHLEGNWGETLAGTGALLPLNADATMPTSPSAFALSELYLLQALPNEFTLVLGKVDWAGTADTSLFANNERYQFLGEAFVNNAVLGSFVPYTSMGAALSKQLTPDLAATLVGFSTDSEAIRPGFDTFDLSAFTYAVTMEWTPKFGNLPGNYNFILGASSKDVTSFDVDPEYLIGEIGGLVPVAKKDNNYAFTFSASQYFWMADRGKRWDGLPSGIGAFFRFGISPDDRNLIDQFYSVGIGGNYGLFGRVNDNWGIGWAGTHISSDFRRDAGVLGLDVDSMENSFEAFYNVALTPAIALSGHVQYVDPADAMADEVTVLSARLQIDF
jgi:porin